MTQENRLSMSIALLSLFASLFWNLLADWNFVSAEAKTTRKKSALSANKSSPTVKSGVNNSKTEPFFLEMSGERLPEMDDFDSEFSALLTKWKIPGASVAIVKNGNVLFARGYGYSDLANKTVVQPDSMFRICSISKVITSVATLKLIEAGKLSLDTKDFPC